MAKTVNGANVTGVNFTATANPVVPPTKYTISGKVSGGAGIIVTLSPSGATVTTGTDGSYEFSVVNGGYTVTAPGATPVSVTVNGANETGINIATPMPITTSLPAGYVVQGGLTWMPVTFIVPVTFGSTFWADANAYCTNTTINGQTGWRMPTKDELLSLANSGALNAVNGQWVWYYVWSSTPYPTGGYYVVYLDPTRIFNGTVDVGRDANYVSCVHPGIVPAPLASALLLATGKSPSVGMQLRERPLTTFTGHRSPVSPRATTVH